LLTWRTGITASGIGRRARDGRVNQKPNKL